MIVPGLTNAVNSQRAAGTAGRAKLVSFKHLAEGSGCWLGCLGFPCSLPPRGKLDWRTSFYESKGGSLQGH